MLAELGLRIDDVSGKFRNLLKHLETILREGSVKKEREADLLSAVQNCHLGLKKLEGELF